MDTRLKELSSQLSAMQSEDAASWLMETYPIDKPKYGEAIVLLRQRSWARQDQVRLAKYYLKKLPFPTSTVYEAFVSIMAIPRFVAIIKDYLPTEKADIDLLLYYLTPVLKLAAKTENDRALVEEFIAIVTTNPPAAG
jgi:hypothetical protein